MSAKFKPVFNPNRTELHKVLPLDTPYCIGIGSSHVCNINCKYCIHSHSPEILKKKGFDCANMPWDIFLKVIEQIKEFPHKIKSISVAGQGEPLCNPRQAKMIKALKEADIAEDVSFITNGLLLTKETSCEIIEAGTDRIFISLQGLSAEKYQDICGVDIDFQQFYENLKFFYEQSGGGCQVNIKIADIALEEGENKSFVKMFSDICDTIHIETIKPLYGDVDYTGMIDLPEDKLTVSRFGRKHMKQKACYLSFYNLCIDPKGDIKPCGAAYNPCVELGNISGTTLLDAWNRKERILFLMKMLEGKRFENPVCKVCGYPDDVPLPGDEIDPWADELLVRYRKLLET